MTVGSVVRLKAFAKLNLFLRVLGKRTDGFHELETILHGIALSDEMTVTATAEPSVHVEMELASGVKGELPLEDDNLIHRAAELLTQHLVEPRGAQISVTKGIPIAAGLGGGSTDAAAALTILAELWNIGLGREQVMSLAALLGSDVPFFMEGGTALATARGELLTPLPHAGMLWFVLAGSDEPLLTRDVYNAWDGLPEPEPSMAAAMTIALGAGDVVEVASLLHNDLEPAAISLRPDLEGKKQLLLDAGARGAAVSGSGPTLFAVADDEDNARGIAGAVASGFDWVRVVSSQKSSVERLDQSP
jgi:4-diphosphocytidyl-2-C-methyl-D-erythritol kinase